jgi:hypothetical protein
MPTTPASASGQSNIEIRLIALLEAWEQQAPEATFAGMTLAEFRAASAPSLEGRQRKRQLHLELRATVGAVANADVASRALANQIICAVKAQSAFGPDSPLYRAMGFIPTSERKRAKRQDQQEQGQPAIGLPVQ